MTTDTFTAMCACGESYAVVGGRGQPHECRVITAQQVRDAWADGYEWARQEIVGWQWGAREPGRDRVHTADSESGARSFIETYPDCQLVRRQVIGDWQEVSG